MTEESDMCNDEHDVDDIKLSKQNRINKLTPTTGKFWCGGCDGYLVGECEKCPSCGTRNTKNRHIRLKKG